METLPAVAATTAQRPWDDVDWRDRWVHIVSDDEHAADLLAEAVPDDIDQRHPYALCGVSLVVFDGRGGFGQPTDTCPECLAIQGE